jgi:hypothetical protein
MQKGHAYYRCTKKGSECQEKHYLREEQLTEQIISFLKKVSLSSEDTEKVLAAFDAEQDKARDEVRGEIDVLKSEVLKIEAKLSKLLDAYLADALTQPEYAAKKEQLLSRKVELNETIEDFADKGLSWLEPAREFVLSLNQATKLLESGDTKSMTTFLKNIGSNHILRNREFSFAPKLQYELAAAPCASDPVDLPFPKVCPSKVSKLRGASPTSVFKHPFHLLIEEPRSLRFKIKTEDLKGLSGSRRTSVGGK